MKERRAYTAEFKGEAVRLSEQGGVSVVQAHRSWAYPTTACTSGANKRGLAASRPFRETARSL